MRLTCDYCGASFDADTNSSCPKCGGGFGNDVEMKGLSDNYKEEQFLQEQRQQQKFEERQKELDGQVKKIKTGCLVIVLIIVALIAAPFIVNSLSGKEAAVMLMNNII